MIVNAEISRASLKAIFEELNRTLLAVLRESLHLGPRSDLEPERLWRVSNSARDDAIGTLMDLHHRLMVQRPIPRPLMQDSYPAPVLNTPDTLRVSHPPPPRPAIRRASLEPAREELALVPFPATNSNVAHSGIVSRASSLSLCSSYSGSEYHLETHGSSSVSARYRDSVSSSLALPILSEQSGKSTADLLSEWKENIDEKRERRISSLPSASNSQSLVFLRPNRERQTQRTSSAPSTLSFSQRAFSSVQESTLTPTLSSRSSTVSRPGLQYNCDGMISGQGHRSDSSIPSIMGMPRMAPNPSQMTNLECGFTHNLPSNSAKASADEFFSGIS